jgi:hypothetical protein
MDRSQALSEFSAYQEENDDGESIYLPPEVLQEISVDELPVGVFVEVGVRHGDVMEIAWNGKLARLVDGELRTFIRHEIYPKWWPEAVGPRFYLDLLHRCVMSKKGTTAGLVVEDLDDSDDAMICLEYSFPMVGPTLKDAVDSAKRTQRGIEAPAERVLREVTRTLAVSADSVSRGQYASISELLARVDASESASDKGRSLEDLMSALFEQVPGFTVAGRNVNTETEEIDLVILNGSSDPIYSKDGPLIIVECKNWTKKIGRPEFSSLETKILNRNNRCTLGFFVSWSGFAQTVTLEALRLSRERYVIICLDGSDVRQVALDGSFAEFLRGATLAALNA